MKRFAPALAGLCLALLPLVSQAQTDWAPCADEGQQCRFSGEALVRYGAEGKYAFRLARNRITCDNDEFGDPAPNRPKSCQVSVNWRQDSRYRGWREHGRDNAGWVLCANEGEVCRMPGQARVRYGIDGRYAHRDATGVIRCSNDVFGDPAPDIAKQCEYSLGADPRPPGPRPPVVVVGLPWAACAEEGGACSFRGAAIVRYGAQGHYAYREANNGLSCTNEVFGTDPAPNQRKRCEMMRGAK